MLSRFSYRDWEITNSGRTTAFRYEQVLADGSRYSFCESLDFPIVIQLDTVSRALLNMLHLALGLSYYKCFLPTTIEHPYSLTEVEAAFWNELLAGGMAEFLMRNSLPFRRLGVFSASPPSSRCDSIKTPLSEHPLLGIGGGKDSIVSGELLKRAGYSPSALIVASGNRVGVMTNVAEVMKTSTFTVRRHLDRAILELNKRSDVYNGHVPFSLFIALIGTLLSYCRGNAWFCVGNEASSNVASHSWDGRIVNHQWSKTLRFEHLLNRQLAEIHPQLRYFSIVRPFTSVAIAKMFSRLPEYFGVFSSDSGGLRIDSRAEFPKWGLTSAKTLSTFVLLSPWISPRTLQMIFGKDLWQEISLLPMLESLLGLRGDRPMDCVGTIDELIVSCLAIREIDPTDRPLLRAVMLEHEATFSAQRPPLASLISSRSDECMPDSIRQSVLHEAELLLQ